MYASTNQPSIIRPNQSSQPISLTTQRKISSKKSLFNSRRGTFKADRAPPPGIPPGRCTSANAGTMTIPTYSQRSRTSSPASRPKPSASRPPSTALRSSSTQRACRVRSCGVSKGQAERRMLGVRRGWKSWTGGDDRSAVAGPVRGLRMYKGVRTGVYLQDQLLVPLDRIGPSSPWLVERAWAPRSWRSFHWRRV
jgi:hypothetical protein